jgi:hypothetical protein
MHRSRRPVAGDCGATRTPSTAASPVVCCPELLPMLDITPSGLGRWARGAAINRYGPHISGVPGVRDLTELVILARRPSAARPGAGRFARRLARSAPRKNELG